MNLAARFVLDAFRKRWWAWVFVICVCLPAFSGCGNQRDQKQTNRGLDRPKYVNDAGEK